MPPLENCDVCSEHFSAETFEVNSLTPYEEIEVGPLVENSIDNDLNDKDVYDDDNDDDYKDPNWNLSNGKKILLPDGNESSEEDTEGELQPSDTDKKYLVFINCLDQLIKRCPKCGVVVTGKKKENNWEYALC